MMLKGSKGSRIQGAKGEIRILDTDGMMNNIDNVIRD